MSIEVLDNKESIPTTLSDVTPSDMQKSTLRSQIEGLSNSIKLSDTDEENGLDLFCYVKCENSDEDVVKNCRGLVFRKDDVVLKAFPYTDEYNSDYNLDEMYLGDFDDLSFFEAHEGSLIRIFYYKKWYISTHRKLNAFRSKWASKESFGSCFKRALESERDRNESFRMSLLSMDSSNESIIDAFLSTLDTNKQYMFLLKNSEENRIICDEPEHPTVFHVGTFTDGVLSLESDIKIPSPCPLNFKNYEEVKNYVEEVDIHKLQGVIVFAPNNKQFKIMNKEYQELFRVRGNEPSIKFRYLQLRMDREAVEKLCCLYPKHVEKFEHYENTLYDIAVSIHKNYVKRFIKKNFVMVAREDYEIIKKAHAWYLEDRDNHRIDANKIIEIMNEQSPTNLNHMIRQYEQGIKKQSQEKTASNTTNSGAPPRMLLHGMKSKLNRAVVGGSEVVADV
jgi:hypothetical protein